MNPIAQELNESIRTNAAPAYECLSQLGKTLFFPKGILTQGSEAKIKGTRFNATVGIATKNKQPLVFQNVAQHFGDYNTADIFPYVAVSGRKKLREMWHQRMTELNPLLKNQPLSLPMVTGGITHGISIAANLFAEKGDTVLLPDMMWGNYRLTFGVYRQSTIVNYRFFNSENRLDIDSFREALSKHGKPGGKLIVLLNFPNNPSGYTCSVQEAEALRDALEETAKSGVKVVCLCDEAYFGLFFDDCLTVSFFSMLVNRHENLMPIKLDGATKELFVWGFRVGFITLGFKCANPESVYNAFEKKMSGLIRGTVSSLNHAAQTIIEQELNSPHTKQSTEICCNELKMRAQKIKDIHADGRYTKYWTPYPFNSGYFMCVKLHNGVNAETLRKHLLEKYQTGTISTSETDLRIAFSCLDIEEIETCFDVIAKGCAELSGS